MGEDFLHRLLRRFGRPPADGAHRHVDVDALDARLERIERMTPEMEARIRILEEQADPRRLRRDA